MGKWFPLGWGRSLCTVVRYMVGWFPLGWGRSLCTAVRCTVGWFPLGWGRSLCTVTQPLMTYARSQVLQLKPSTRPSYTIILCGGSFASARTAAAAAPDSEGRLVDVMETYECSSIGDQRWWCPRSTQSNICSQVTCLLDTMPNCCHNVMLLQCTCIG